MRLHGEGNRCRKTLDCGEGENHAAGKERKPIDILPVLGRLSAIRPALINSAAA
jgi:hypothetical protein